MLNPLYLALTTPHGVLRPALVPHTKQALIKKWGEPRAWPGRFGLDLRKEHFLHQDSRALEQGPRGLVGPLASEVGKADQPNP